MSPLVSNINQILSILTVVGQVIIALVLIAFLMKNEKVIDIIGRKAVLFSFVVVLIATLGSLFFSEIAHFEPCKLCWFQRILMYPQVLLLGIALIKKDKDILDYTVWLSVVGAIIAIYHYLLQIGVAPSLQCSAVGYSASCSQRFIMSFGYITIPMMALTAFIMTIAFATVKKIYNK